VVYITPLNVRKVDMAIKITPKLPLMVVDPLKGIGLTKKENSNLPFTEPGSHDLHNERDARGPAPRWEKGLFIDIYA
jgi:hypothetical protein